MRQFFTPLQLAHVRCGGCQLSQLALSFIYNIARALGGSKKKNLQFWTLILLCCGLQHPKADPFFASSQGSGIVAMPRTQEITSLNQSEISARLARETGMEDQDQDVKTLRPGIYT